MRYGIQTWDARGVPNNYGVKPVSVIGTVSLSSGQTSGSYSFEVPDGFKIGFVPTLTGSSGSIGRQITLSRTTVKISAASLASPINYPGGEAMLIIFMEAG